MREDCFLCRQFYVACSRVLLLLSSKFSNYFYSITHLLRQVSVLHPRKNCTLLYNLLHFIYLSFVYDIVTIFSLTCSLIYKICPPQDSLLTMWILILLSQSTAISALFTYDYVILIFPFYCNNYNILLLVWGRGK